VRIVSLLPSATEILFALGLGDQVEGVTFECDHPPAARAKRVVSTSALPEGLGPAEIDAIVKEKMSAGEDLYRLDAGALSTIQPDLVVTQDLCAVCAVDVAEVDDALAHLGCSAEVLTLDPMTLEEVIDSVAVVGRATGREAEAQALIAAAKVRLAALDARLSGVATRPTLVLEWTDPAFSAGHWIPDLVTAGGGQPVLASSGTRSVGLDWADVRGCGADVVVVAPCGFRLDGARALAEEVLAAGHLPDAEVWAVDADAYVVRPGPRVVDGAELFGSILHPDRCGPPDPGAAVRLR
jgi:iron complex transport system substrate-binding protein